MLTSKSKGDQLCIYWLSIVLRNALSGPRWSLCHRDWNRGWKQMGCMKLCGNLHITPEPGHGLRPIIPGPGSAKYEFQDIDWFL